MPRRLRRQDRALAAAWRLGSKLPIASSAHLRPSPTCWPVHVAPWAEARAWVGLGSRRTRLRGGGRLAGPGPGLGRRRPEACVSGLPDGVLVRWDPAYRLGWPDGMLTARGPRALAVLLGRARGTDDWGTLTARAPGESRQTERSSSTGATRLGGSGGQRMLWRRRPPSAAREAGGSRLHRPAAVCVRSKSGHQAVRGSGPETEGDTQRVGAGMLTCVTDGCRARQVMKYESHPSTRARCDRQRCARALRRVRVPSGNLKFDRRPRPVMSRSMTWPKPGLTRPTRTELRGRRPSPRRWPPFR